MNTLPIIDNYDYPIDEPEPTPKHHAILSEIAERLTELGEISGEEKVFRIFNQLFKIYRQSPRAYRLVLDVLSKRDSISLSLEQLASNHRNAKGDETKRQNWLQNMQADVALVKLYLPEWGQALDAIMKRRSAGDETC